MERSKQMAQSIAEGCSTAAGYVLGRLLFTPIAALWLMLLVGVIHNWLPAVPTIGYLQSLAITVLTVLTLLAAGLIPPRWR